MSIYLITSCSRGIGLELTTQLAQKQDVATIIVTARKETEALNRVVTKSNGKVVFFELDVSDVKSIQKAVAEVAKKVDHIDVLINNAAIEDDLDTQFQINVVGVQATTAAMLPLLQKGRMKKVFNMSSSVGSISWSTKYSIMNVPGYKVFKAALNMLTVQWALSYRNEGFTFIVISPGWIRTDLGTQGADLSVQEGVSAILDIVDKRGTESTGKFYNVKYSTASRSNHEWIKKLGASEVFDYHDEDVVDQIITAAKAAGKTIKIAFDPISEGATFDQVPAAVAKSAGGGKVAIVLSWLEGKEKPSNIDVDLTVALRHGTDQFELGAWFPNEWLQKALQDDSVAPAPPIEIVEGGLETTQKVFDHLKAGVSGGKLVMKV